MTPEQRRADALGLLAERAFAAGFAGTRVGAMTAGSEGARGGATNEGLGDERTSEDHEATSAGAEDATTPEAAGAHIGDPEGVTSCPPRTGVYTSGRRSQN